MAGKYDDLDLGGLQLKCNEKTDETLESTRRMLEMCGEAKQAGTKTLMSLDDQAEQLDNIEGNLDKINNDMAESEKAIKDMDRAFGIIPKFWKKNDGFKEDKETWAEAKPSKGFEKAEALEIREGAFVAKITNDEREEEMEENMEQVGAMIGNLRNMANDMGQEVHKQNDQLDRINKKAESDKMRVKQANDKAQALLK